MPRCIALIVAAGSGERFGGSIPKQYQELAGQAILRRSVLAFLHHPHIDGVQIVFNPTHRAMYDKAVGDLNLPEPVVGGASRQESVRLGLEALASSNQPDLVMIHDAARPLIDAATITDVRKALDASPGAIAAKPLVDTLKRSRDGHIHIETTIDRNNLWQAHTPQSFHFDVILKAHQAAKGAQLTDDAAVAEKADIPVTLVPSNPDNMKITNIDDLDRAARLLGHSYGDIRTGMGFDVHRLIPGDKIYICGIAIPHNRKAEGHSDADVGLHALVDAVLGAMSMGDIGTHFPPSDPQWKGADSALFVRHAVKLVSERGGIISNVDVTLMCEAPRIGPHREAMVKRMAELLEIPVERVSVKATTTERLGFTGREEGIAAHAIATLRFPGLIDMFPPDIHDLAQKIIRGFTAEKKKIVTAESCTGGLIAAALTEIPGSSAVVERGFISYSNDAKLEVLGVLPDMLSVCGAVSEQTAEAMAVGALEFSRADVAVSVTGIAGPDGGTTEKPVGLVYIGIATSAGVNFHLRCQFKGDRGDIRMEAVREALTLLESQIDDGKKNLI